MKKRKIKQGTIGRALGYFNDLAKIGSFNFRQQEEKRILHKVNSAYLVLGIELGYITRVSHGKYKCNYKTLDPIHIVKVTDLYRDRYPDKNKIQEVKIPHQYPHAKIDSLTQKPINFSDPVKYKVAAPAVLPQKEKELSLFWGLIKIKY